MEDPTIAYTETVRRPDPRLTESWCREGATHDHGACGNLWDSTSRRDTLNAVRWADEQREPWRFDTPEVPDSVMAFRDVAGLMWVRVIDDPPFWGQWWGGARGLGLRRLRIDKAINFCTLPLVECEDPRGVQ
jgi:hypothetical protein